MALQRPNDFLRERPEFSHGSLRWLLFTAASNGLHDHGAIIKVGRRIFIDVERFDAWVASHRVSGHRTPTRAKRSRQ